MATHELLTEGLEGWRMAGAGGFRKVDGGLIESFGGPGLFWYAGASFGDFLLTVDWRLTRAEDNSGVFLRCPLLQDDPQPGIDEGYEVQIDDRGLDPEAQVLGSDLHLTGSIYKLAPAIRRNSSPIGQWNVFEIEAKGPTIAVKLNGLPVSQLEGAWRRLHGHVALQAHDENSAVQFRRLTIAPLL